MHVGRTVVTPNRSSVPFSSIQNLLKIEFNILCFICICITSYLCDTHTYTDTLTHTINLHLQTFELLNQFSNNLKWMHENGFTKILMALKRRREILRWWICLLLRWTIEAKLIGWKCPTEHNNENLIINNINRFCGYFDAFM